MTYTVQVKVMPLKDLLDPQGKAVTNSMKSIGLPEIDGVRIGRHIRLFVEADSKAAAEEKVTLACQKMLANQIMESFHFSVTEA